MNLNFLITKNHIFKRRKFYEYKLKLNKTKRPGIYLKHQLRFELINLKIFKRILRKKYYKKNLNFKFTKYWLMIRPNFLLTMKSKNSRMGSGVGSYVRVSSIIKADTPIILLKNYSHHFIKKLLKYIKMKMNVNLYLHLSSRKIDNFV